MCAIGSIETIFSPGRVGIFRCAKSTTALKLSWRSMTPLGALVVPDV